MADDCDAPLPTNRRKQLYKISPYCLLIQVRNLRFCLSSASPNRRSVDTVGDCSTMSRRNDVIYLRMIALYVRFQLPVPVQTANSNTSVLQTVLHHQCSIVNSVYIVLTLSFFAYTFRLKHDQWILRGILRDCCFWRRPREKVGWRKKLYLHFCILRMYTQHKYACTVYTYAIPLVYRMHVYIT